MSFLANNNDYNRPDLCFTNYEEEKRDLMNYIINDYLLREEYANLIKLRSLSNFVAEMDTYHKKWKISIIRNYGEGNSGKPLSKSTHDKIDREAKLMESHFFDFEELFNLFEVKEVEYLTIDLQKIRENKKAKLPNTHLFPIVNTFFLDSRGGRVEISERDILKGKAHFDYYDMIDAIRLKAEVALLNLTCNLEIKYPEVQLFITSQGIRVDNESVKNDDIYNDLNRLVSFTFKKLKEDAQIPLNIDALKEKRFITNNNEFNDQYIEEEFKKIHIFKEKKALEAVLKVSDNKSENKRRI